MRIIPQNPRLFYGNLVLVVLVSSTITLFFVLSDFGISADKDTIIIPQGERGELQVTVAVQGFFQNPIAFSVSGAVPGLSYSASPSILTVPTGGVATTILTLYPTNTQPGDYMISVQAAGGGRNHTLPVNLIVSFPRP